MISQYFAKKRNLTLQCFAKICSYNSLLFFEKKIDLILHLCNALQCFSNKRCVILECLAKKMQCSAMPDNAFSTWMMAQAFVLIQPV
jgi:hypothetical protein